MNTNKIFLLGVGCQKGGTTWLHSQLEKYENINLGFCKEYHYFDALYLPLGEPFKRQRLKSLKTFLTQNPQGIPPKNLLRHLLFLQDENSYYEYFNNLWSSDERISIVGDITPSYNSLKSEHFSIIKQNLENLGFSVKIIFLMRDPIERIWSYIRMKKRDNKKFSEIADNDLILQEYKHPHVEARSRYDLTMQNLEKVFAESDIFYCLYEDLFRSESINRLQDFLGLNKNIFNINVRKNASQKEQMLDAKIQREIANYYRNVYDFVGERFSIEDRWHGIIHLSN